MKTFVLILIMIITNLSFAHDHQTLKEERTQEHVKHNSSNTN